MACPGRLLDHLRQGTVNLSHVEVLVLDEADRMLDMGFLPNIRDILQRLPAQRQNLLFSATMPRDISQLAAGILRDPLSIQIEANAPVSTVAHALYPVEPHLKTPLLLELLKRTDTESVLVVTRTKHRARRLSDQLQKAGHKATCLQGNLSQNRRRSAMDGFRRGTFQVLVATDIAARGIDVSAISHVINYDMPDTVDAYTHRIGRTGRAARTGDAFTLTTPEDTDLVRGIERLLGAPVERRALEGFDYAAQAPAKSAGPNAVNPRVHRHASPGAAHGQPRYGGRPAAPRQSSTGHRHQTSQGHDGNRAGSGTEATPRGVYAEARS